MIVIADSGSTKTSWCLIDKSKNTSTFLTNGINPFFRTSEDIETELRETLVPQMHSAVEHIFFYGAGIINEEKGSVVKKALANLFLESKIEIHSDLLAAAHATLGSNRGIACILGTGSNSCLFNGEKIVEHVSPLGFILGDEGSGAVLGRKLLSDYLKGIMPQHISEKFKNQFPNSYADFMNSVYKKDRPNLFLSAFVPFIKENIQADYCETLITDSFTEFLKRNVFRYSGFREVPINFVGSVAFYFQEQLKKVMEINSLHLNKVVKEPLNGLVEFHMENRL